MQKLFVSVKPRAKQNKIQVLSQNQYKISVTAEPRDGKANAAVIREFAAYLDIAPSRLTIIAGHSSKKKTLAIDSRLRGNDKARGNDRRST